ncbi:hypothetical protein U9M48_003494, partial [Paspalum notatum var. saurae]
MWKWEKISMDFIVGLPRTPKGNDSIWVIVDRLTKSAHFIPMKATHHTPKLAELYIQNVLRLHGVPISIITDRGPQFTAKFWKSLHEALSTKLDYSTAYHPQTNGQTEQVNQLLEDLLRACVLTYGSNWEDSLPYAEFSYNNSYQASIEMSPFQALYGCQCRTPLMWEEAGEKQFFGLAMFVEAAENVAKVRDNLRIAQSHQKSYADKRRCELTVEAGEFVYLKVSPLCGTKRFHTRGKLAPRYIKKKNGDLAYELELPEHLSGVHPVFHVSQLRKYRHKQLTCKTTWCIWSNPCRFLTGQKKELEEQGSQCAKCYGAITQKERLHGRRSQNFAKSICTSSRMSKLPQNLKDEIL